MQQQVETCDDTIVSGVHLGEARRPLAYRSWSPHAWSTNASRARPETQRYMVYTLAAAVVQS